jgi:hypothetical protein
MVANYRAVGPHAQTIFLGCSVTEASMTLAWGSEASTCEVKLVNDYVAHHRSRDYNGLNTAIDSIHSTLDNTTPSTALAASAQAQQYLKPIINYEKNKKDFNTNIEGGSSYPIVIRDLGKKCWNAHNYDANPYHWVSADPGFLGDKYSIVGAPCYFRFEDLVFAGFVNRWTYDNGVYSVSLTGPGSLLKGCKLIINDYYGSVSTLMPFTNDQGRPIAVPYNDPTVAGSFGAEIAYGNIPNLINVFGWLQYQSNATPPRYGFARVSDYGISAAQVYDTLLVLLGGGEWDNFVDSDGNPVLIDSNGITRNKFSPYGGIVSRSPLSISPDGEVLIDTLGTTISSQGGESSTDLTKLGLLRTVTAVDNLPRPIFRVDFSNVPRPDPNLFLPLSSSMPLDEFIDFCCKGAGYDWNCTLVPAPTSSQYTAAIVINTYSRRVQYPPKVLRDFITSFQAGDNVVSYDLGEEYKDQNVRKVVMGGKQERLAQFMTHTLSKYRNSRIYNPLLDTFMPVRNDMSINNLRNGSYHNIYREPIADAQRMWSSPPNPYIMINGGITAQRNSSAWATFNLGATATSVPLGGYATSQISLTSINDPLANTNLPGSAAYPIHFDLISPYFGIGSDGYPRRVFYDRKLRQLKVNIPISDIANFFPVYTADSGYLTIMENEIRAAKASFDSWIAYLFDSLSFDVWKPSARLIYTAISSALGPAVANSLRLRGFGITKSLGKQKSPYGYYHTGNPVSPSQAVLFSNRVMPMLQNLHSYISDELGQHYGKDYLVRMPTVNSSVGADGVRRYDYEITDSGWEEPGNALDDTLVIGSTTADLLAQDNGKFGPILGWNNSAEQEYSFVRPPSTIGGAAVSNSMGRAMATLGKIGASNAWYYPLRTDGDFIGVPYTGIRESNFTSANPGLTDSFGVSVPNDRLYKIYQKASIPEKTLIFDNTIGVQYAMISASSPVFIHDADNLQKTILLDCALSYKEGEETASYSSVPNLRYMQNRFLDSVAGNSTAAYLMMTLAMADWALFQTNGGTVTVNNETNMPIHERAAMPCFAAIPVKYNMSLYGPWSTSPGEIADAIFPNTINNLTWVDNVVGGVDLDINSQYVPWEYGGMDALDTAVLTMLGDSNEYQQIEEAGRLTLAGIMLNNTNMGSKIFDNGPLCNSIGLTFGNDGIRTTYHFRTFSRKLGYFNKENADNIQKFGKQSMQFRSQLAENINKTRAEIKAQTQKMSRSYSISKAGNFSPVSVLVGAAYPFLHKNSTVNNFATQCQFDPGWPNKPIIPNSVPCDVKAPKHISAVSLYDPAEMDKALFEDGESYSRKSVMSLDGIFSPISLYPTPYFSTFPITKYRRSVCPQCMGVGDYTYNELLESTVTNADNISDIMSANTQKTIPCPFCLPDTQITEIKKISAQPAELTPPYLIGSGTDRTIINDRATAVQFQASIINNYTLNPIVLSATGADFNCLAHKQANDRCGYSIDVLAFGNVIPSGDDALRSALSEKPDNNYNDLDLNANDPRFTQNYRFFGLRGPLMLHSWGYDLEGYPVPNASGEYLLTANGIPVVDSSGNKIGKNQQLQSDGSYTSPYKERSFMKGWAQQPGAWPVGPIDLRWDDIGRVWTIGANYKPVWVVVEQDLVNDTPARGIVIESSYTNNPLPSGLRKLVFVKDNLGMFSAPRGAALYCKYDSVNGFYEPIYNRPLVTTGLMLGGNSATIYTAYTPSSVSGDIVSSYTAVFDNPLNIGISSNTIGLFTFLNGKWILQAST